MDSRSRRDGAAIEELGWYNPIDLDKSFSLKDERILHWLKEGAQTTDAAHKLLRRAGIAHKWHLITYAKIRCSSLSNCFHKFF